MKNEAHDLDRTDHNQKWYSISGRAWQQTIYVDCLCVLMATLSWLSDYIYKLMKSVEKVLSFNQMLFQLQRKVSWWRVLK